MMTFTVLDASNTARVYVGHYSKGLILSRDWVTLNDDAAIANAVVMAVHQMGVDMSECVVEIKAPSLNATVRKFNGRARRIGALLRHLPRRLSLEAQS